MLRSQDLILLLQMLRGRGALGTLFDLAGLLFAIELPVPSDCSLFPVCALCVYVVFGMAIVAFQLLFTVYSGPLPSADLRALAQTPVLPRTEDRHASVDLPDDVESCKNFMGRCMVTARSVGISHLLPSGKACIAAVYRTY